ncbi:MAG: DnaA regulatory inactivator Hda [Pseudomonadota bacterium]
MSSRPPRQLSLGIRLDDAATFENFFVSDLNRELVAHLRRTLSVPRQQYNYLWGVEGAGSTHLLQALCHQADDHQESSFYIPLANHHEYSPAIFEGLESLALVCLDDVQAIAGNAEWELGLFNLFNRLRESGTCLCIAATMNPRQLPLTLPDLLSRLLSGVIFSLQPLEDADKIRALQLRAQQRGFEISEEVANYVLQRNDRGMNNLFALLERLDQHSLETKRRITIPLVRELMGWSTVGTQSDVL